MIKINNIQKYTQTPWKNGKGLTREIAIFPLKSTVADNNFLWRLSSATITSDNPFSQFPGYNRLIAVWKGDGLLLNQHRLALHTCYEFSGDDFTTCNLINDKVEDLGLIYNPEKIKATVEVIHLKKGSSRELDLTGSEHFLFIASGDNCLLNFQKISLHELCHVNKEEISTLSSAHECYVIKISIKQL